VSRAERRPLMPLRSCGRLCGPGQVWSYGLSAFVNVSKALDPAKVQLVGVNEYLSCLRERVFGLNLNPTAVIP
jgi:hypothetical protein